MENKRKPKNIKGKIASRILILAGIIGGVYVGGWIMVIKPIMMCCQMADEGILTAVMVGKTVLSCLFATTVGLLISGVGLFVGKVVEGATQCS